MLRELKVKRVEEANGWKITIKNRISPRRSSDTSRKIDRRRLRRFGWVDDIREGVEGGKGMDGWIGGSAPVFSSWRDAILSCLLPSAYANG